MNLNNKDVTQIKLYMSELGWDSREDITKRGWGDQFGYSIWFERWDWHGIRVGKICIHEHTSNLENINQVAYDLAVKACKAYDDFTDAIPTQMADYSLQPCPIQTPYYQKALIEGENKEELIQMYEVLKSKIWEK